MITSFEGGGAEKVYINIEFDIFKNPPYDTMWVHQLIF